MGLTFRTSFFLSPKVIKVVIKAKHNAAHEIPLLESMIAREIRKRLPVVFSRPELDPILKKRAHEHIVTTKLCQTARATPVNTLNHEHQPTPDA